MFGIFKTKSEADRLQEKYGKLMAKWHKLSTTNRAESDKAYAEAQEMLQQIDELEK